MTEAERNKLGPSMREGKSGDTAGGGQKKGAQSGRRGGRAGPSRGRLCRYLSPSAQAPLRRAARVREPFATASPPHPTPPHTGCGMGQELGAVDLGTTWAEAEEDSQTPSRHGLLRRQESTGAGAHSPGEGQGRGKPPDSPGVHCRLPTCATCAPAPGHASQQPPTDLHPLLTPAPAPPRIASLCPAGEGPDVGSGASAPCVCAPFLPEPSLAASHAPLLSESSLQHGTVKGKGLPGHSACLPRAVLAPGGVSDRSRRPGPGAISTHAGLTPAELEAHGPLGVLCLSPTEARAARC